MLLYTLLRLRASFVISSRVSHFSSAAAAGYPSAQSWNKKKKAAMAGDRTSDVYPNTERRRSPFSFSATQQSVSSDKSSVKWEDRSTQSTNVGHRNKSPHSLRSQHRQTSPEKLTSGSNVRSPGSGLQECSFDICRDESGGSVKLNKSLLEINREKRKEQLSKQGPQKIYLRSGMVLLKNYIGHSDQVRIIQMCRKLGIDGGGFYTPGYESGAKLHLRMMCLGKDWDPESRLYELRRSDGALPPEIPEYFKKLVDEAIRVSHEFLRQHDTSINVADELPIMSPDIGIVNFYSNSGKLGLHQDRDESRESISKGLPVVSVSLGHAAEFLYGEERDEEKAGKIVLESGDVLIFGGKSRLIFHGVKSILADSSPKRLMEETKLKPGRLNLTFRKY